MNLQSKYSDLMLNLLVVSGSRRPVGRLRALNSTCSPTATRIT